MYRNGQVTRRIRERVCRGYCAAQEPLYYNHPNGSSWHQGESIGFPNYVDMPHTPRYPFGYGLSYTGFAYSGLGLSKKEIGPDETMGISFRVRNTGERAGIEVVQLYVRDRYASMVRPNMELAGFARIPLQPGEEKQVTFALAASQLAFLDLDYRWKVEVGDIDVLIGASSADIRLEGSFRISAGAYVDGKGRAFRAAAEIKEGRR